LNWTLLVVLGLIGLGWAVYVWAHTGKTRKERSTASQVFLLLLIIFSVAGTWRVWEDREMLSGGRDGGNNVPIAEAGTSWDPDYFQIQKTVTAYIQGLGQEWGVYFKDLTSGKTWGVNEELQVPAASTVKVPVVLYASHLVSQGRLSWNEGLEYVAERDWRSGAGSLQFTAQTGDIFTIRELADYAIVESDNVAWKMLERRLGRDNIAEFMRSLGGKTVYPGGQNVSTPKDMAIYMEASLDFSKQDPNGKRLIYNLSHTIWNTGLNGLIADQVEVGHKEGDVIGVANDVGIIYAEHPYILSIMSKGHEDVEAGFDQIAQISKMIYDYQVSLESPNEATSVGPR
jgi:beta-lactamase class A